ncbi:ovate family protein 12, ARABIDOPSIS THALIANA OVATE FAMILY PROTEIN 12 [Hibiscus trionum]|uniref:Transcription repressor n=1 Tax=Hibiscus trionum TaxID=183268 RepID=A0A9W7HA74_HIBTR|nr:ovate family protein 12, ARABIDOPSIS THALIANA OVATE FAMILY PROTEIN 12 [Hibiscus trionum]
MPTTVGKNLNLCFIKIKFPLTSSSLLTSAAAAAAPSSLLFNNYNSPSKSSSHSSSSSNPHPDLEPDFATAFASNRFFFTSPGSSNSIIESTPSSTVTTPKQLGALGAGDTTAFKDGVAVPTFSPDPYMDFRRSMQEMVEARDLIDVKAKWDYLHELLLCYLALNPKSTHKIIVGAFADLVVSLMSTDGGGDITEIAGDRIPRQCM